MAITYPLDTPESIGIENITIRAVNAVATSQSPFSYKQQIISHGGQRWEADVSLPTTRKDLMAPWVSMLIALKGQQGTFLLADPDYDSPQGDVDYCLVTGNIGDETVSVGMKGTLKAGDYIQLGLGQAARLHKVLQDQTGSQRNLLTYSDPDSAEPTNWTDAQTGVVGKTLTTLSNGIDGIEFTAISNRPRISQTVDLPLPGIYTCSVYVEDTSSDLVDGNAVIQMRDGTAGIGSSVTGFWSDRDANGRVSVEVSAQSAGTVLFQYGPGLDGPETVEYSAGGPQLEKGSLTSYQATQDAASFSTDDLEIWPALRANQSSSTAVLNKPKGVFRLKNNVTEWSVNNSSSYGLNFEAVEVIT